MSKKAAKKATKPQFSAKGKAAPKQAAKKSGKDGSAGKSEAAVEPAPSVTQAPPAKAAKRRVTVSVSAVDVEVNTPAGETSISEAKPEAASTNSVKANKKPRRIIAVPSAPDEKAALETDAAASDATSQAFANSPFAADVGDDAGVDVAAESERGAAKRKKPAKRGIESKSNPSTDEASNTVAGEGKREKDTGAGKGATPKAKTANENKSAEKQAKPKQGGSRLETRGDNHPEAAAPTTKGTKGKPGAKSERDGNKDEGSAQTPSQRGKSQAKAPSQRGKSQAKAPKGGETTETSLTERAERKSSQVKAAKASDVAQAELALDEPTKTKPDVAAATGESAKGRGKRRGATAAEPALAVPAPPVAEADEDEEQLTLIPGEGIVSDDDDDEDEAELQSSAEAGDDEEAEELSEEEENRRYLKGIIEALLFASDKPLTGRELARAARIDKKRTLQLLVELRKEYRYRGVNIAEVSGGYVLRSNPAYGAFVQKALALRPVKLSRAQLETLAIIAYRQPITRPEIDDIRGVDSGQVLKGLADRDLIKMLGKKDEAGRPMLYGTTQTFLELFSLDSLKGLPNLREFTELSEDSREKFAAETGETIPGPTVISEEGGDDTNAVEEDSAVVAASDEPTLEVDATDGNDSSASDDDWSRNAAESGEAVRDADVTSANGETANGARAEQSDEAESDEAESDEAESDEAESDEAERENDEVHDATTGDESDDEDADDSNDEAYDDAKPADDDFAADDSDDEDEPDDSAAVDDLSADDVATDRGVSDPDWDAPPEADFPEDESR